MKEDDAAPLLQEREPGPQVACTHETVRYVSEARPAPDGSAPTPGGHWECDQCGARFWPEVLVDRLITQARRQAGQVP